MLRIIEFESIEEIEESYAMAMLAVKNYFRQPYRSGSEALCYNALWNFMKISVREVFTAKEQKQIVLIYRRLRVERDRLIKLFKQSQIEKIVTKVVQHHVQYMH